MNQDSAELPDILIERGSYTTRCGYVGEEDPISTFRTPSISVEAQFRKIFEEVLKVDPVQYKVVIVKNARSTQKDLKDEADLLFTKIHIKACAFVSAQTGILFSWVNKGSSGLIIDIGYESTLVVPIIEFMTRMDHVATISVAGRAIEQFIINNLLKHGISKNIIEKNRDQLFPYLMKDYFYFNSESEHDFEREAIETRKKSLPNYMILQDKEGKSIKLSLPSPILPPKLIIEKDNSNHLSFSEVINKKILKIFETFGIKNLGSHIEFDHDPYTSWWVGRIIITGGTSNILGLRSLLIRDLLNTTEFKRYTGCDRAPSCPLVDIEFRNVAFTIRNVPPEHNHSSWLGASIISSLKRFKKEFVSNEGYQNSEVIFQLEHRYMWKSLLE